jgi:SAM-dependent methyltransferase
MSQRKRRTNSTKPTTPAPDNHGFYRSFEERFRGPRAEIKKRFKIYLPFVKPLLDHHRPAKVLDLGCGRGEWLELMRETGFEVEGVDLDAGMLEACIQLDLPSVQGDAIDHLKKMDDNSHSVISAFHVVEHIAFERLNALIVEALRVLKPAGLLILETPNPENIVVATSSFYLDPTHLRPIPPDLLAFLPENNGFKRSKILRLQESKELSQNPSPNLLAVLNGVSPDYAVIAQKAAPQKIFSIFDEVFSLEFGLTLDTLTHKYQQGIASNISTIEQRVTFAEDVVRTISGHDEKISRITDQNTQLQVQLARSEVQAAQQQQHSQWLQAGVGCRQGCPGTTATTRSVVAAGVGCRQGFARTTATTRSVVAACAGTTAATRSVVARGVGCSQGCPGTTAAEMSARRG